MDKLFKVGGVSKSASGIKVRFANDMTRVKILAKTGSTDIEFLELPQAMTKGEVVTFLKSSELYARADFKEAIDMADAKYNSVVTVKASKGAKVAPSLDVIKARAKSTKESVTE